MNYFLKSVATAILIVATVGAKGQDLARKIPSDALAVATLKGNNLLQLMSVAEFNKTFMGSAVIGMLSKASKDTVSSVEDLGMDLSSNFYYYNQSNDSVTYNCFLAPVKDVALLDQFFSRSGKNIAVKGNLKSYTEADSTEIVTWTKDYMLMVIATGKDSYFSRPEIRERMGLKAALSIGMDQTAVSIDTVYTDSAYTVEVPVDVVEEVKVDVKPKVAKHKKAKSKSAAYGKKKSYKKPYKKAVKKKARKVVEVEAETEDYPVADSTMLATTDYAGNDGWNTTIYSEDDRKKKAAVAQWADQMVTAFVEKEPATSILNSKDFVNSIDQQAELSIWISGAEDLMNAYATQSIFKGFNFLKGYKTANAKLFLEDKAIRMTSALTLSEELGGIYRKINKRKVNKQFLNYINEDKMIGYIAYSMDSKAYLEEYPKLMSTMYSSVLTDEISMGTDLFSLLLDEEAVSKVLKGDALFVLNGLIQKDVTYKSQEYNEENFETEEVTKTKKETLPDFLFMTSTEDTRLLDKLIAYGVKKEVVKDHQRYFELAMPKSPMAFYFAIKNGVIFFGSNAEEIEKILSNNYQAKVSSKHKKLIGSSNYAAFFSAKKLSGKIPAELASKEQTEKTNKVLSALGDIYIRSNPMKGNAFSGELSMDIPADQKNAFKYLMFLMEDFKK